MSYCANPKEHRAAWWTSSGFEWFDYRRKKVVPSKTASVICEICHVHWGTTNKELVAKLRDRRPMCHEYGQQHRWQYHSETLRRCLACRKEETRQL